MSEFEGTVDMGGRPIGVSYEVGTTSGEYVDPSTLVLRGLTLEEAYDLIAVALRSAKTTRAAAPAAPAAEVGVPAHHEDRVADEKRRAEEALAKVKASTAAAAATKPAKPAAPPKPAPKPAPEPEPEAAEDAGPDDDLDGDEGDDPGETDLNVVLMNQQEKLRPVIEHMIDRGFRTAADIVAAAIPLRDKVAAFKAVDAKGGFEKRIERAALVVLAGDES